MSQSNRSSSAAAVDCADVVVVGSGFAGMAAAVEAARAGCSVIVVEKRNFLGGNSGISGGALAAVDPESQRRHGIADSTRLMYQDMMRAGRGINNPELVRLVCMHSHETLQWLRQDLRVRFIDRIDQLGGHSVPRCHSVEEIQGRNIINPMLTLADRLRVRIELDTRVTQLVRGADGANSGVRVTAADRKIGPERLIVARNAVVLAAGGFSAETDDRWVDGAGVNQRTSLADSTAEVLMLAKEIGAELIDMEHLQMLPCASPDEPGRGVAPVFASYIVFPYGVMVDPSTGRRFVNEWADRKTRADAMNALTQPAVGIADQQALDTAGEVIKQHTDPVVIRRFPDLDTLAAHHRIPLTALEDTLRSYNGYIQQRCDNEFGKPIAPRAQALAAPFYSVRLRPKAHSTMGGVRIDARARVLNGKGRPIPRLYAAGEVTGGIHGASRLACCAITECLVFGRIAGRRAALEDPIEQGIYA